MPSWLAGISMRMLVIATVALFIIIGSALFVRSCDKRHARAAQARVEAGQTQAATNSAQDAINVVAASGEASRASEDLTRNNETAIRNAPGANDKVNSGVDAAGRAALCKRQAYKDDPRCKKP